MSSEKTKGGFFPHAPAGSWILLLLVWLTYAFNCGCRELMNKFLPSIVDEFALTSTTAGLLSTAGTVSVGIGAILITAYGERKGMAWYRKKPQLVMAIFYLAATFLIGLPIAGTVSTLIVLQIIRFGFAGPGESYDASAAADWWPKEHQGFVINAHHTGYPWGSAIVILIATAIFSSTGNWRSAFIIIPLIAVVFWVIYLIFAKKSRFAKNNEKIIAMGRTPRITVEEVEEHREANKNKTANNAKMGALGLLKNKNVLAAFIVYLLSLFAYYGFNYWLTPFLAYQCGYDYSSAAALSIVFTITAGLGQIFWGAFSDKFGAKRTVQISLIWLVATFLMLPLISKGIGWLIGVQLLMGFCMNAAFPLLYRIAGASVRPDQLSSAIACCTFSSIFGGTAPLFLGLIMDSFGGFTAAGGYTASLIVLIVILAIAFLLLTLIAHEVSGPRRGKDFALTSYESCGIEQEK